MSLKMSSILQRLRAHIIFFKNLFPQDITCALYLQGRESIVSIFVKKKDKQTFFSISVIYIRFIDECAGKRKKSKSKFEKKKKKQFTCYNRIFY